MKNLSVCLVLVIAGAVGTGCSVDEKVGEFEAATATLVDEVKAAEDAKQARANYDANIGPVEALWGDLKDARGFQISDEAKEKLKDSTVSSVRGVCGLTVRGAFDESEAKTYESLCSDYAKLLEVPESVATSTVIDKTTAAKAFARALEKVRAELQEDGEPSLMGCVSMDRHKETAEEHGFDAEYTEYERLCNVVGPTKSLKIAVEEAEVARKNDPDKSVLSECYNASVKRAIEKLEAAGKVDSDEVSDLSNRWQQTCDKG
jgi:hypothetical protein